MRIIGIISFSGRTSRAPGCSTTEIFKLHKCEGHCHCVYVPVVLSPARSNHLITNGGRNRHSSTCLDEFFPKKTLLPLKYNPKLQFYFMLVMTFGHAITDCSVSVHISSHRRSIIRKYSWIAFQPLTRTLFLFIG